MSKPFDLRFIQEWLEHESSKTTEIYTLENKMRIKLIIIITLTILIGCNRIKNENNKTISNQKQEVLSEIVLKDKNLKELRILRNEIFARHGYIFKSIDLSEHFTKFNWYKPQHKDVNHLLTNIDKHNISLIQSFEDIKNIHPIKKTIIGQWLNKKYINELIKTKSARHAQMSIYLAFVEFDTTNKSVLIYSFHESVDREYNVYNGMIRFKDYELSKHSAKFIDKNTLLFTDDDCIDTLLRYDNVIMNRNNLALNRIVFEGKYHNISNEKIVEFSEGGNVSGIGNFTTYFAFYDYIDFGMEVDKLRLINKNEKLDLCWSFNNDTLFLHKIQCLDYDSIYGDCLKIAKGEILYKLLRNNK